MTTTSARRDASFIDFAAFGVGDEELQQKTGVAYRKAA